jgi:2-polyprenyl-3-methyl-5-hydroxy-6-metoxy-1,4-benzoquinol methylase
MQCPICLRSDNVYLVDEPLHVHCCGHCTHRFSVIPREAEETYDAEYFLRTHKNWFAHPDIGFFGSLLTRLQREGKKPLSVIDVGCGNGDLLSFLHERDLSLQLTGIDLIDNNHPQIRFVKGDVYQWKTEEKFDALVCLHTIEHVNDPQGFARILQNLVKPGGLLIVATIDSSSLIYRIAAALRTVGLRGAYNRIFSRHHLHHFSSRSLATLLENNGFQTIEHFNYNHPLKSVDVPGENKLMQWLYLCAVRIIFTAMRAGGKGMLQAIVGRKER